jgi:transposase InsO family protein
MPWQEVSTMDQRQEFVMLARLEGANRRELCRRFGISAQTGYKWLKRSARGDDAWYADTPRRPHRSPGRLDATLERAILEVRDAHPAWGARKIAVCLERAGLAVPAVSTIHAVLARHGRIIAGKQPGEAPGRFEYPAPNLMWQMDFKGKVAMTGANCCHPLTVIDDHSRFLLCLAACANEQGQSVRDRLTDTFRCYGLPEALLVDNGSPWGHGPGRCWTKLGVWLLKLGVDVIHSRPYHPQTRGKNERLHRTLKAEVLAMNRFHNLAQAQRAFDQWLPIYNTVRPHEALDQQVPASRYAISQRRMPDKLPAIDYQPGDIVRRVGTTKDYISFKGKLWRVPAAFAGERVALRPTNRDGRYGVYFAAKQIASIDLDSGFTDA